MMRVYHGSTVKIENPIAEAGRDRLDFGKGFYLTPMKEQAVKWAIRMGRIKGAPPVINVYDLDLETVKKNFRYKCFDDYNLEWLLFIVKNRQGGASQESYDIVEGGVADDRVIDSVEAYMADLMPLGEALRRLSLHKPNSQICIRNQQIIDEHLYFVESYRP